MIEMNEVRSATLMTPGPVNLHPRVMEALARPMQHHRTAAFRGRVQRVNAELQTVFGTRRPVLTLTASGSGGMEAAMANLISPGERVAVIASGKFGERWAELAAAFGAEARLLTLPWGKSADPAAVERLLAETRPVALFFTYCETSTGSLHPVREIAEIARRHGVLTVLDAITGVLAHPLPMDEWGLDVVVGGSQKAFMLPPGLAFVAVSARAEERLRQSTNARYYLDLRAALDTWEAGDFPWTPAISLLAALEVSLEILLQEGVDQGIARFAAMADRTRRGVRELGLEIYPDVPSNSLTVVKVPEGCDGKTVLDRIESRHGLRLAGGQGKLKGKIWRFGHMGFLTDRDVEASLAAMGDVLRS
jgi:aspartate aminotransferase-like enzyme